ncbi:MAG: DUF6150 family protein [Ignavibacterium sp.]|nr:DUF6150 family protein [Ignavibacterium sp.]MCX7610996.1 DUF6150 family protein [Ignavibacterium sp.]MDW8376348.1 DUF6150 family protein [Ignavibacteriales bacterium]
MFYLALIIIAFYQTASYPQLIYSTNSQHKADIKVFVVDYANQADLKVYKVNHKYEADGNQGLWYFVDYEFQADKKIHFVKYMYQADLKIYFVKYKYQAGWNEKSKMHLLY